MAFNFLHGPGHHDFQAEINNYLHSEGLPLRCGRRVETNGHCYYDSILALFEDGLIRQALPERAQGIFTVPYFRRRLVTFIKTNKELQKVPMFIAYKEAVLKEKENRKFNGNWDRYLYEVATTEKWADQLTIFCTALFINKNIFLAKFPHATDTFYTFGKKPWDLISGKPEGWTDEVTSPPLILGYLRERHFEPLTDRDMPSPRQGCLHML